MPAQPKLDDQFWFDYSKDVVEKSGTRRTEAAAKLATLLVWLWGIYTAAAAVGTALVKENYPTWALLFVIAPVLILPLAYWAATYAQMPSVLGFDPRSPDEISEAFSQNVTEKNARLHWALWLTLLSAVFVATAIVTASLGKRVASSRRRWRRYG
jgi:hypothetical protein